LALTAKKDGNNVGSLITAKHGGTATYLVGFTNKMGRKTNANYLLLWKAILNCMELGVKWFDVGGIDENNTPGIAHFKEGLGGEQYNLMGEYSACKGIRGAVISLLRKLKT
jgi:lipid II:glycine glycyltransferase (peptidoglycan interpeptide bridge formation enzyme)